MLKKSLAIAAVNRPAARCLRHSLLDYASGDQFNPDHSLDPQMLETVLR